MKRLTYILGVMSLISLLSCEREDVTFTGSETQPSSGTVTLATDLDVSDSIIHFPATDSVVITAEFSEEVTYELKITGTTTGAEKTFIGTSQELEVSWFGNAETVFFQEEACAVELKALGESEAIATKTVQIGTTMNAPGTVIADFEELGLPAQVGFWEPDEVEGPTQIFCGRWTETAVEGNSSYKVEGLNVTDASRRFLGLAFTKPINGSNGYDFSGVKYNVQETDASKVWFNIWIYGEGKNESMLAVKLMQDDDLDGEHDGGSENGYEYVIDDVSHHGWKLFSVRYDQLITSGNAQFGGSGDKVHRPNQVAQVEFALWSKVSGSPVEVVFDYPIFTLNKPLGQ